MNNCTTTCCLWQIPACDRTKPPLEYRDVKIVRDYATNETILEIEVRGKRGVGYCKSTTGAVRPFQRLKKRNNPQPTDPVVSKNAPRTIQHYSRRR